MSTAANQSADISSAAVSPTAPESSRAGIPWQVKFLTLAVIWGSSFLFMKVGLAALHPIQIATARILLAAAVLVILARVTRSRLPRGRRVWAHIFVSSIFLTALPFTGFVLGETRVASAIAGIGNATTPMATVVMTLLLLPAQRPTREKLFAVALGFCGVIVIAEPWNAGGRPDPIGFLIVVLSGCCYGVGWTYNRRFLADADLGGLAQPAAMMLCGSVIMVPVALIWWLIERPEVAAPWSLQPGNQPYPVWAGLLCVLALGVVGTGLAYLLQYDVVRAAGAVVSTTVTYLIPVVSVLLGVLVLGEHIGAAQLGGFAIVLLAAVLVSRTPKRA